MTTRFKKIVCPIDFDGNSLEALAMAADLARQHDATVYVVHALGAVDPLVVSAQIAFERARQEGRRDLENIAKKHLEGVKYETMLRVGNAANEIVAVVSETGADLVVMATHGRTGMSHMLMGSVAEKVVRRAPCPVLTVRTKSTAQMAA